MTQANIVFVWRMYADHAIETNIWQMFITHIFDYCALCNDARCSKERNIIATVSIIEAVITVDTIILDAVGYCKFFASINVRQQRKLNCNCVVFTFATV